MSDISIIVPLYNEELVFSELVKRLESLNNTMNISLEVLLIDDGSKDRTSSLIKDVCLKNPIFKGLILSRNFGHQLAITAGMQYAKGTEAVMIIDGDLQDPPELLIDFYKKYKEGYDVVYAVRKNRKESFFKKWSYSFFYRFLKKISNIEIPLDSGDFSLISRKVVDQLNNMPEESRFVRGLRSWVGFNQIGIEYNRAAREQGVSKYSFLALLKLALNGIFNFSEYPIKFITSLGFFSSFISGLYLIYVLIDKFIFGTAPAGFTAIVVLICLFGGIQLIAIGIIGEYIVRIFFQSKGRPLYIVKEFLQMKDK